MTQDWFCDLDLPTLYNNKWTEYSCVPEVVAICAKKTAKHKYRVSMLHILL